MAAKVLIVDDHPAVREGLAVRISSQPDLEVCGQAADTAEAMQLVAAKQPDAAIPLLEGLTTSYKMRNWDNEARKVMAQIYLGKNDAKKAAAKSPKGSIIAPAAPTALLPSLPLAEAH